jgi:hypothetical protein
MLTAARTTQKRNTNSSKIKKKKKLGLQVIIGLLMAGIL